MTNTTTVVVSYLVYVKYQGVGEIRRLEIRPPRVPARRRGLRRCDAYCITSSTDSHVPRLRLQPPVLNYLVFLCWCVSCRRWRDGIPRDGIPRAAAAVVCVHFYSTKVVTIVCAACGCLLIPGWSVEPCVQCPDSHRRWGDFLTDTNSTAVVNCCYTVVPYNVICNFCTERLLPHVRTGFFK